MKYLAFGSVPLLKLATCLMAGIVVGEYVVLPVPVWPVFAATVVVALLLWRNAQWQSAMIGICFVVLGALVVERQRASLRVSWPEREVRYEAVVLSRPVEKPKTMAVDVMLATTGEKLKCYFYKDERSRRLQVGDGLLIQSRIQPNSEWRTRTFNYRRYLEIHGFTGSTFVSSWKWRKAVVSLSRLSRLERTRLFFLRLRSRLQTRFGTGDSQAVVAAMALGDKSGLSDELKDVYARTGASHVLALSGLHLAIIYTLLSMLVVGRRWQVVSQFLIVLGIWAFVFLVGMPVSVVRAAVMLSVYGLLSLGHREKMSVNVLSFTAIVMLLQNPLSLFDVGFQLSYAAVLAIMLFVPLLDGFLSHEYLMSHRFVKWGWGMVAVSCAAQIGTAPLVAYYFGRLSTYFLLTNFVVIPATTLILYLSIVVMAVPALAYLLIYIVGRLNAVLLYIASLPGASVDGLCPSVLQTAMVYVVIVAVYLLAVRITCIRASARHR